MAPHSIGYANQVLRSGRENSTRSQAGTLGRSRRCVMAPGTTRERYPSPQTWGRPCLARLRDCRGGWASIRLPRSPRRTSLPPNPSVRPRPCGAGRGAGARFARRSGAWERNTGDASAGGASPRRRSCTRLSAYRCSRSSRAGTGAGAGPGDGPRPPDGEQSAHGRGLSPFVERELRATWTAASSP